MPSRKPAGPVPYQVLARKYRPQRFDDVVGQGAVVSTLRHAITQGRLHHAYLLSGTRGVGKTTLARLFARALNCAEGPTVDPCGRCDACLEIAAGSSMDVIEIDGASNRKVEDVDPLREAARYAPARDRHRIFIIDEVHMLSETAFNALLKTLEEPPPRVIFLFATTEPEQLPDTILSRCLHLACRRVGRQEIAAALAATARSEKVEGENAAFELIAAMAAGSMRDGLSLLDQVLAFAGDRVTRATVQEALGLIDRGVVREFLEAIGRRDATRLLQTVEKLSEAGADLTTFARDALARVRDTMVVAAAGAEAAAKLGLDAEETAECATLAGLFSKESLLRLLHAMLDLADRIRREEHPRYLLEAAGLRMIHLTDLAPLEELIRKLDAAGALGPGSGPSAPALRRTNSEVKSDRGPAPAAPPAASSPGPAGPPLPRRAAPDPTPRENGPRSAAPDPAQRNSQKTGPVGRILDRLAETRVSLATFLGQARGLELEGDALRITAGASQGFLRNALELPENLASIREAATAVLGRPIEVLVAAGAQPGGGPGASDQPAGDAEPGSRREALIGQALKDPAVRAAMEAFKGQIVNVREGS